MRIGKYEYVPLKSCALNVNGVLFLMAFALVWITLLNFGTSFGEITGGNMTAPFSPEVGSVNATGSFSPEGGSVNATGSFSPEGGSVNATGSFSPSTGILKSELNEKKN